MPRPMLPDGQVSKATLYYRRYHQDPENKRKHNERSRIAMAKKDRTEEKNSLRERYLNDPDFREKRLAYQREYYEKNKEHIRAVLAERTRATDSYRANESVMVSLA